MQPLHPLNSREVKPLLAQLRERFGFSGELDYAFLLSSKDRVSLVTREISRIPLERLRINSAGMYFGELKHGELRLSIEGAQLIGPSCSKNILELETEHAHAWLKGEDLPLIHPDSGYVLIRHGADFLGCGKATSEKILNFVPKNRRVRAVA